MMRVKKHSLYVYIITIILVAGSSGYLRALNEISILITLVEAMVAVYCTIKLIINKKIDKYACLIILFYAFLFISTVLDSKDYSTFRVCLVQGVGATFFLKTELEKNHIYIIKAMRDVILCFLIINLFMMIIRPNGFMGSGATTYYFLGYRIGFTPFVVGELFFAFCYDYLVEKKLSFFTLFSVLIGYATVLVRVVSTGIAGITIVLFLILILYLSKKSIDYKLFLVLYSIVFIAIVVFEIQYRSASLSFLLTDVLGKEDLTFDNRTTIWAATIIDFMRSPFIGHGSGALVSVDFVYSSPALPAHNQILSILNEGGLISFGIFLLLNLQIAKSLKKIKNSFLEISIFSFLAGYYFMMITEIQTTKALIFLIFATAVYLPNIIYQKNNQEYILS